MPPDVVTSTVTFPLVCGGTLALICCELSILMLDAAAPPKLTAGDVCCVPDVKFEPLIMTIVPPVGEAELGTIDVIFGAPPCCDAASRGVRAPPPHPVVKRGKTAATSAARPTRSF